MYDLLSLQMPISEMYHFFALYNSHYVRYVAIGNAYLIDEPFSTPFITMYDMLPLEMRIIISIIIIIIKRGWQCKGGRERLTPYQSDDPNPTTPTHRKKEEKLKTVGDKK